MTTQQNKKARQLAETQNVNSVFGGVKMGYLIIESEKLKEWHTFGEQGLGLHVAHADAGEISFRLDDHAKRIIVQKGPSEDFVAIGWELQDQSHLDTVLARLRAKGIPFTAGSERDALKRGVMQFWQFTGPKGLKIEIYVNPVLAQESLSMLTSGFNTGDCGMGHIAMVSRYPEKTLAFWQEIFDARISDYIAQNVGGPILDVTFLRMNPRHHSVAVAATRGLRLDPIRTRIQHFNIEAATMEDMSHAYERLKKLGYTMAHGIGQHPNDRELSFYVLSPSGFEIEFGWAPILVDETTWQTAHHDAISVWGHHAESATPFTRIKEIQIGVRSLLNKEFTPL